MKVDKLTGIKIGGVSYQEGASYTDGSALTNLLSKTPLGALGSLDNFEAQFDITKKRFSLFITADVSAMGLAVPLELKFVMGGTAAGKKGEAKDFTVKELGAGLHVGGLANTEAIGNADVRSFSVNKALTAVNKNPRTLLNKIDLASAEAYTGGVFAGQIGTALSDLGITLTDRSTAVGAFGSSFPSGWWNNGI